MKNIMNLVYVHKRTCMCSKSTSQYLIILFVMLQDNELHFTVMPCGNDCKTLMQKTNWTL
jgi:hypothetical protein